MSRREDGERNPPPRSRITLKYWGHIGICAWGQEEGPTKTKKKEKNKQKEKEKPKQKNKKRKTNKTHPTQQKKRRACRGGSCKNNRKLGLS